MFGLLTGFPPVHLDDLILVDVFEDVRRVDENANSASGRYGEKHVQLQTINDHGHVLPVLANLKKAKSCNKIQPFNANFFHRAGWQYPSDLNKRQKTDLRVFVFVSQMLRDELNGLCGFVGLRGEKERFGWIEHVTAADSARSLVQVHQFLVGRGGVQPLAAVRIVMLPLTLPQLLAILSAHPAIRMMQIGQLHHLHFAAHADAGRRIREQRWGRRRRRRRRRLTHAGGRSAEPSGHAHAHTHTGRTGGPSRASAKIAVAAVAAGRRFHHPPESGLLGSFHEEQDRKIFEEDDANPVGHAVGARTPEVPVDDDHRHQDGQGVHDESEEQILGDERQDERSRRKNLGDEQQEHNQRQENADAQRDFLAGFGRQVEDQDAEEGNEDRGENQVDRVEERLAADRDRERDVHLGGFRVVVHVALPRHLDNVPSAGLPVIRQVDVVLVQVEIQRHLVAVERPGAEFKQTRLLVEREVRHVDRARTLLAIVPIKIQDLKEKPTLKSIKREEGNVLFLYLVDGWRHPEDFTARVNEDIALVSDFVVAVGAARH